MELVSGAIGHEKVHYKAIPVEKIYEEIEFIVGSLAKELKC